MSYCMYLYWILWKLYHGCWMISYHLILNLGRKAAIVFFLLLGALAPSEPILTVFFMALYTT